MKKNKIILILLFIIIILIVLAILNKENIQKVLKNMQMQEIVPFTYDLYIGEENNYTVIIKVEDELGIKQIEYPNSSMILYCKGKKKVTIDYDVIKDTNYSFKVINENGEENIYNILIDSEYIDNIIKINVSSETQIGTKANINIQYGKEGETHQYVIGRDNENWNNYTEEFELTSYNVIENKWGNEDFTTTIKARIVDEVGNVVQISKNITCLDIDIASEPVINSSSNGEYPVLTVYGIQLNATTNIEYDTREDITNYYSIDDGKTWQKYEGEFNTNTAGIIIAKSIKDISGLEIMKKVKVQVPTDSLTYNAYDNQNTTYDQGKHILMVDEQMQEQTIRLLMGMGPNGYANELRFIDENNNIIEDKRIGYYNGTLVIPKLTRKIEYQGNQHGTNGYYYGVLYEIGIENTPVITSERYYPIITSTGMQNTYSIATVSYYPSSIERLYKIDDGEWLLYEQPISIELGKTLYAKGIDKYGNETIGIASYKSEVADDALPYEAFDEDLTTYICYTTKKLMIDSSVIGKELYFNADTVYSSLYDRHRVVTFYSSSGEILKSEEVWNSSGSHTIPKDTSYVIIEMRAAAILYEIEIR